MFFANVESKSGRVDTAYVGEAGCKVAPAPISVDDPLSAVHCNRSNIEWVVYSVRLF